MAKELGWPFYDADDFHPDGNVAKMAAGHALDDNDRWPWLDRIVVAMQGAQSEGGHAVLACSALKQVYRERLGHAGDVRFVHLRGDAETIAARLAVRSHKYMPASLLLSQFATLEEPADALVVDIRETPAAQVQFVCEHYALVTASSAR
ncbi:MAG: gluconokinase, GntK/IdnK-type [Betaproteobacteria bacterium]